MRSSIRVLGVVLAGGGRARLGLEAKLAHRAAEPRVGRRARPPDIGARSSGLVPLDSISASWDPKNRLARPRQTHLVVPYWSDQISSAPQPEPPLDMSSQDSTIAAELRDAILRGQYRCGERLPSERDLAQRFGVHRSTVREAFSKCLFVILEPNQQGAPCCWVGRVVAGRWWVARINKLFTRRSMPACVHDLKATKVLRQKDLIIRDS